MLFLEPGFMKKALRQAENYYQRQLHGDKYRAYDRARKDRNGTAESYHAAYRKTHIEASKIYHKERLAAHPGVKARYCALWRKTYPEKVKMWNMKRKCKKNNFTPQEFTEKLKTQEGKCAICGVESRAGRRYVGAVADHDHKTGLNRAILCSCCNLGLGHYHDDPSLLRKAAEYLESYLPLEFDPWPGEFKSRGLDCLDYLDRKEIS